MNAKERRKRERERQRIIESVRPLLCAAEDLTARINFSGEPGLHPEWLEASATADGPKLKTFSGVAYTGGLMKVGFGRPVAIDLEGLQAGSDSIPFLKDHDATNIVGHGTAEIGKRQIKYQGVVSGQDISDGARQVVAMAANKFPWQVSVGVDPTKIEPVEAGATVLVNGRNITGPAYIVRAGQLREISFLAIGADGRSSAIVASQDDGSRDMGFEQWLIAKGFDIAKLDDKQKAGLRAMYDADVKATADKAAADKAAKDAAELNARQDADAALRAGGAGGTTQKPVDIDAIVNRAVTAALAATTSQVEIERVYAEFGKSISAEKLVEIKAKATSEKWDRNRVELECRREARPVGPAIHILSQDTGPQVISASFRRALTGKDDEKSFAPQTLEASRRHFKRGIGLQRLLEIHARANGWHGDRYLDDEEGCLRAAFSTVALPNILTVNFNYMLLQAYNAVEDSWRQIAAIGTGTDFKQMTRYRMTGDMKLEVVGATGEIAHGGVGEQSFTNQIDTLAKMLVIPRKEIVNDSLNAFATLAQRFGRGGALAINDILWTAFMAGTGTFWHTSHTTTGDTGNANYATGTDTVLNIAGLTKAELMFYNQVDPDGNPLGVNPRKLVVPNALNVTATQLMNDTELRDTTSSTKYTTGNPHRGKFEVVRSSYLSNSLITGNSVLAWYLTAAPEDLPVIEAVFLNGQQTPVVESAEADFDTLGMQMRGVLDFGCAKQDFRGGVKMKGEA